MGQTAAVITITSALFFSIALGIDLWNAKRQQKAAERKSQEEQKRKRITHIGLEYSDPQL